MKKIFVLIALLAVSLLFVAACAKLETAQKTIDLSSIRVECPAQGGNWIEDAKECEFVSSEFCASMGGSYDECASACRNDPNAQICTMQCVQVCSFKQFYLFFF